MFHSKDKMTIILRHFYFAKKTIIMGQMEYYIMFLLNVFCFLILILYYVFLKYF